MNKPIPNIKIKQSNISAQDCQYMNKFLLIYTKITLENKQIPLAELEDKLISCQKPKVTDQYNLYDLKCAYQSFKQTSDQQKKIYWKVLSQSISKDQNTLRAYFFDTFQKQWYMPIIAIANILVKDIYKLLLQCELQNHQNITASELSKQLWSQYNTKYPIFRNAFTQFVGNQKIKFQKQKQLNEAKTQISLLKNKKQNLDETVDNLTNCYIRTQFNQINRNRQWFNEYLQQNIKRSDGQYYDKLNKIDSNGNEIESEQNVIDGRQEN